MSTENLELKGTKETGTKEATNYQIIEEGEERLVSKKCGDWTSQDTQNGIKSKQKENWKLGCL